jgi:hypothetical protein
MSIPQEKDWACKAQEQIKKSTTESRVKKRIRGKFPKKMQAGRYLLPASPARKNQKEYYIFSACCSFALECLSVLPAHRTTYALSFH